MRRRAARKVRCGLTLATVPAVFALVCLLLDGQAARAVDTIWTFNGDGNWTETAKWSNDQPVDSTFDVIIDDGDTAVIVTLNYSRTIGALALGADDTLLMPVANSFLETAGGITNAGSILLTGTGFDTSALTVRTGALTNSTTGLLHFQSGGTGRRTFTGDLINNGTVIIDRSTTFNKNGGSYANNNQLTVGAGASLTISAGTLQQPSGGSLILQGGLTSANGFTNSGSILLTGTSSGRSDLTVTAGALTNSATGLLHFQTGGTGERLFHGDLINNGRVTIDHLTWFSGFSATDDRNYLNNNQFTVAAGASLAIFNTGTFQQASGTLDLNGPLVLWDFGTFNLSGGTLNMNADMDLQGGELSQNGGTLAYKSGTINDARYSYWGGSITGTPRLSNTTLSIGPAAADAVSFLLAGNNVLAGDVHAGQTLTVQGGGLLGEGLTSANGFTNSGSILLTGTNSVALTVRAGPLTNSATGLLHFQSGGTRGRTFTGDLINNGTVTIDQSTSFNKSGGSYTNNNELIVGAGASLTISGTLQQASGALNLNGPLTLSGIFGTMLNLSGGTLKMNADMNLGGRTLSQTGGTLAYSSGTINYGRYSYLGGGITGTPRLSNTTLSIGPGAVDPVSFLLADKNSLSGDVHAGQTLTVQGGGLNGGLTAASSFSNAGSILLTGTGFSDSALTLTTGTLTNSATGLLHFQTGGTGRRTFTGDLINNGKVTIDRSTTFNKTGGSYTNNNQFTVGAGAGLTINAGTFQQASGALNLNGSLVLGGMLNVTGGTLTIQNTSTVAQGLTSGNITNSGSILLTGTSSGASTLTGALTNSATGLLHFQSGGTGGRTFTGDLINNGTVTIDQSTTFNKNGGSYTNNNQFTVGAGASLTIDNGGTFQQASGTLDLNGPLVLGGMLNLRGGTLNMNADMDLREGRTLSQSGGTLAYSSGTIYGGRYSYLGGAITGTPRLSNTTLSIGPAAADRVSFLLAGNNSLSGNVRAGQTLTVQNTSTVAQGLTSSIGFTNSGSILLTGTSSGAPTLTVTTGTLTNSATGLLHFQTGGTGGRAFTGDLINDGTVTIDQSTTFNKTSGSYRNNNQFTVTSGGSLTIDNGGKLTGTGTTTVIGNGVLTADSIRQSSLSIGVGGRVTLRENSGTSVFGALAVAGGSTPMGKLDVTNNPAIVDYPPGRPSPAATIRDQIIAGRGGTGLGRPWNGPGITSSTAQADVAASPESTSVGYAENSALPLGPYTSFHGQAVNATSILFAFTRTGDANLDGMVNDDDVTIVGAMYAPGVAKPHWALGDFDYNGFVDDDDVTLLGAFYDPSAQPLIAPAPVSGANAIAVPEPTTLNLMIIGLAGLIAASPIRYVRRRLI